MTVVTRFAPSPTGYLHIGGARTALFSWLYAKHTGGKFMLRIEDTDKKRSTEDAVQAIYAGLQWLGLDWDDEPISQASRAARHAEVAQQLLAEGKAYHCYCSPEELQTMRDEAKAAGKPVRYDGRWRNRDASDAPEGVAPVIRLKAPETGETVIEDKVQGTVRVSNEQLDDFILLRADGSPTYMLAVVVDDFDMGVTHVIRGDDHLTNCIRQSHIYQAMGWDMPVFAHIPLIHGADGAKLSKRHGALGVDAYRDMGFLPEAIRNYLLRLGWGHGDEEIISDEKAIEWFDFDGLGKAASRFDMVKLTSLNAHYIKQADDDRLASLIAPLLSAELGITVNESAHDLLVRGMAGLKDRAKTLLELAESAVFYLHPLPLPLTEKAEKCLDEQGLKILLGAAEALKSVDNWSQEELHDAVKDWAEANDLKLGKVAQPLRSALTGSHISPSVFEVMAALGRDESLARLAEAAKTK